MSSQPKYRLTLEEYFELERTSEVKYEYFDGEVFAMSGASPAHEIILLNVGTQLVNQMRGRRCFAFPSSLTVNFVPETRRYARDESRRRYARSEGKRRFARRDRIRIVITLRDANGARLAGRAVTIMERVESTGRSRTLCSGVTDANPRCDTNSNGQVIIGYVVPTETNQDNVFIKATFAGDAGYKKSEAERRIPIGLP